MGTNGQAYVVGGSSVYFQNAFSASAVSGFTQWTEVTDPFVYSNVTVQFNAVSTFDGVNVIMVGNAGLAYYTSDMGASWAPTTSSLWTIGDLYCVSSGSASVAYAGVGAGGAGGTLLKTTDGGATWTSLAAVLQPLLPVNDAFRFHAISALTSNVIYASSATGVLVKSVNGGRSFTVDAYLTTSGAAGGSAQSHCLSMRNGPNPALRGARGLGADDAGR